MITGMSDRVWDRKTGQLIESLRRGAGLETGLAPGPYGVGGRVCGRYECRARPGPDRAEPEPDGE